MVRSRQTKYKRTQNFRQQKIYIEKKEKKKTDYSKFNSFFSFKRFFVLLIIILLVWWIFFSKSFSVKDIIVQGNNLIPSEKISSEVPLNQNIFLLRSKEIENNIKAKIPEVDEVQVYKGFPDAVKVVVIEYDQSTVWKSGMSYFLLDSQGRVYKDITNDIGKFGDLAVVEDTKQMKFDLGQQIVSPGFVAFVGNIKSIFTENTNLNIDRFSISETTFDLNLYTKEGIYIKFDTSRSSKKQMDDLKSVLVQKRADIKEYVDMRIDGWAYYK